jgi:squalene-hopene/tetraprenyl-beta-curcumene cyclase
LIPLLIVFANQPVCRIPKEQGIDELYVSPRSQIRYRDVPPFNKDQRWFTPHNFFVQLDGVLKLYDRMPLSWLREKALHKAATWMLEHIKGTGGLGAIYPAMANTIVALRCLGYQIDDPLVRKAFHEIEALEVYDTVSIGDQRVETLHLQPCHSPIWDTALLMNALIETGMSQDHPSLLKAGAYLVSRQTKTIGDWKFSAPDAEPGGWYFQFENELYPDVDDSAVVLMALSKIRTAQTAELQDSIRRGKNWVLAMQGSDGGWARMTKTLIESSSTISRLPTTMRCLIRVRPIWPGAASKCLRPWATIRCTLPWHRPFGFSSESRRPTAVGTVGGASITFTAPGPS